ncbi:hypothetical protein AYJ57_04555 [Salipiger sp. CCB-MM3]|uniref:hypothetical protein n=1 Tax=Salipiger sp. CCB-MM3 TaxID=1792508 RepID=UPI00080A9B2B|nr:hypothetical protein [Salipiger sp. CCB-MM3]ANT59703.1 hypothetical protein AYJ57_04555 [Salipiger sp. CCB-MM3]
MTLYRRLPLSGLPLSGLLLLLGLPAAADQSACGPRDQIVARLAATYGETRQSIGIGNNNAVMELFASDETGSWTITVTGTDGVTCLVASGLAFEALHEPLPPADSDA